MKNYKKLLVSLVVIGLNGCGGGSSSDTPTDEIVIPPPTQPAANTAPTAVQDNATTSNNAVISIDVLANDSDPESDSLTITEIITDPSFGTAAIVNNQIEFTPQQNFAGTDSITYRVSDGELAADAEITLALTQSIALSGTISDLENTDALISVEVGNDVTPVQVEDSGEFSIGITVTDSTQFIRLTADSTDQQPFLVSILGYTEQLIQQSGEDRTLTPSDITRLNLNQISTAFSLIAVDLNGNNPFVSQQDFERVMNSINARDALDVAAFMRLIDNDNEFSVAGGTTVLSVLDSNETPITQGVIQQYLTDSNLLDTRNEPIIRYQEAFDEAVLSIVKEIPTNFGIEKYLNTLTDEVIQAIPEQQQGFLVQAADTYTLNVDGTGTFNPSAVSSDISIFEPVQLDWTTENGQISISYNRPNVSIRSLNIFGTEFGYTTASFLEVIEQRYGSQTARLFRDDPSLRQASGVRTNETGQTLSLLNNSNGSKAQIIIMTNTEQELILPEDIDFVPPVFIPQPAITTANLSIINNSLFTEIEPTQLEGDWAFPLVVERPPNEFGEPNNRLIREKLTFDSDGTANGEFSGNEYNWSVTEGTVILSNQNERYEIIPLRQVGKEYQVLFTRFVDDQISLQQVSNMAQFDNSFTDFTNNIVTDLPVIYTSNITNIRSTNWVGDTLRPNRVFGHHFNGDGTALSFIRLGFSSGAFEADSTFDWTITENKVSLLSSENGRGREWEVISVDDNNRILVWERRTRIRDENNNGDLSDDPVRLDILPRINILNRLDLSQYPDILERSTLIQGNQGHTNNEDLSPTSTFD